MVDLKNRHLLKERPRTRALIAERGLRLVPGERNMVVDREGREAFASEAILKQLRKQQYEAEIATGR